MAGAEAEGKDRKYYLDDLRVGQRFVSDNLAINATQIKEFASAYDPQPFQLDEIAAGTTLFGGLAASGWHTAAP
jgi:acyl dehydratase